MIKKYEYIPASMAIGAAYDARELIVLTDRLIKSYDFREINQAIADAKLGAAIKPVLRINKQ